MAMHFSFSSALGVIALGFLVAGILHANNIRDIESDRRFMASRRSRRCSDERCELAN